ncbi:MAG TPA: SIMPL domain-containing protein, partial [Planctomycetaceae bacterium]|nr:SIMPL domain-containing protein [Planctomycetaceae bacterium]
KQQVIALGADKASVKVQPAQIVKATNDRQQQIQMMMRQRMQQGGRKKEPAKKAEPIQVAATFTAEWKLSAKSHDELLTTTHQVQQKLKALDLAGTKDAKKLSPEEQEALEEAQSEFGGYEDPNAEQPGQPTFLFVAEIPSAELDKAHAEAFQKATAQAERLAKATGRQLGELQAVSSVEQADNDDALMSGGYGYQNADYRMLQLLQRQRQTSDAPVAMGIAPGKVKHTVTLTASYSLKAK